MRRMGKLGALGLVSALLLAGGCASFESFTPPEVSLVNIHFSDLTLFESSGVFILRVSNENPDPVVIDGGVFTLYLNGLKVGTGMSDHRLEIPRLGSVTDEVEVHVNNIALATRLVQLFKLPVLDYRIKSKLYVERPYGTRRMKSVHEGRFELPAEGERIRLDDSLVPPQEG